MGILAFLLVIVATLKKEDIEVIVFFIITMLICFLKNKIFIYILNNGKDLKLKNSSFKETIKMAEQISRQDLNKYKGTGEIFKFEYMGEKDLYYKTREVVVEDIYMKNGYEYIKAYDINIGQIRTFRKDRIMGER